MTWPEGKRFAFTVFDDADNDRLDNTRPVYDFLGELGFRTTKSAWLLPGAPGARLSGLSCEEPAYLGWVQSLQREGFEIGWHGAAGSSSTREETIEGFRRFHEHFGEDPRVMSNHFQNNDSIYWGAARLTGWRQTLYRLANRTAPRAEGHVEGSPYFWGDLCRERLSYVRNWVFRDIDTLAACPLMPYHDPARPFARAWYASAEGGNLASFNTLLHEKNQDRLAANGGACIVYAHFAKKFYDEGRLDERFVSLMKRLASLGGWLVPVSTLLDYLAAQNGGIHQLTDRERAELEWRWLRLKLRHGSS
ncbi:MAG: hypothetical protein ABMA13_11810 [Chthoniobacteraceae bacterium]